MTSIAGPSRDNGGSAVFQDGDVQLQKIQHGRNKAVAARALKRGQTILDGPPAAVMPLPDSERCHRCLRAQVNVGCQNCGAEGYCSVNCEYLHTSPLTPRPRSRAERVSFGPLSGLIENPSIRPAKGMESGYYGKCAAAGERGSTRQWCYRASAGSPPCA